MTGKFEWIKSDVAQWVPDRFWPAHSTIALSVGGVSAEIKTGPAVLGVADISDHTFTVSVDGVPRTDRRNSCRHRTTNRTGANQA